LPVAAAVPVRPVRGFLFSKTKNMHRISRRIYPGVYAVFRLQQVRMRIETGIDQREGYALAGESGIAVQAQARRQNSESGLGIEWPHGLNRLVQRGVALGQKCSQQVFLNAGWTGIMLVLPEGIPLRLRQKVFAGEIPTHRASEEVAH
jgi:hypothetical protein